MVTAVVKAFIMNGFYTEMVSYIASFCLLLKTSEQSGISLCFLPEECHFECFISDMAIGEPAVNIFVGLLNSVLLL
jgi:hypothetical protein